MKKFVGLSILLLLFAVKISADTVSQWVIKGYVLDEDGNPLIGATVCDQSMKSATIVQEEGYFELKVKEGTSILRVDYVGYDSRLHEVLQHNDVQVIVMKSITELAEVVVTEKGMGAMKRRKSVVMTEDITSKALTRAACCNLSESFETNPSVDVAYSDAVTGAKQIQLLGLSGTYVQMLTENFPDRKSVV